ncbi:MAG: hypothetical protein WCX31_00090 [Salinivirgaceae bacterium]|jgi:hypothetical protein
MKFQSEFELVSVLKETLRCKYKTAQIEIFEEVSLGYGIADIIISRLKKPLINIEPSFPVLNVSDINIFNLIQINEGITFDTILDTTKGSRESLIKSLDVLIRSNYLYTRNSAFFIRENYELPFHENFAIEAKLKDWKRALNQAYRYKWFAEYSYVVLDSHFANPAIKNMDLFSKFNIGLASISKDGKLIKYFTPKRHQPYDKKMQILLAEKIKNNYEFAK